MNSESKSTPQELIERARQHYEALITETEQSESYYIPISLKSRLVYALRQAMKTRDKLADALEVAELLRYSPTGDNHHNAATCPYCRPKLDQERDQLRAEVAKLTQERDTFRRWANLGGAPTGRMCLFNAKDEHEIHGPFFSSEAAGKLAICQTHAFQELSRQREAVAQLAQSIIPGATVEQVLEQAKVWREALEPLAEWYTNNKHMALLGDNCPLGVRPMDIRKANDATVGDLSRAAEALRPAGEETKG